MGVRAASQQSNVHCRCRHAEDLLVQLGKVRIVGCPHDGRRGGHGVGAREIRCSDPPSPHAAAHDAHVGL